MTQFFTAADFLAFFTRCWLMAICIVVAIPMYFDFLHKSQLLYLRKKLSALIQRAWVQRDWWVSQHHTNWTVNAIWSDISSSMLLLQSIFWKQYIILCTKIVTKIQFLSSKKLFYRPIQFLMKNQAAGLWWATG